MPLNANVSVLCCQEERSTLEGDASQAVMRGSSTCVAQHGQYCQFLSTFSGTSWVTGMKNVGLCKLNGHSFFFFFFAGVGDLDILDNVHKGMHTC